MKGKKFKGQSQDEGFYSMEAGPSQRYSENSNVSQMQSQSIVSQSAVNSSQSQRVSYSQNYDSSNTYAGTILKITLKNFMCHGHLEFKFNPKTNYIIGKNGSGKSAIQTAICIVLGAKASATNRAGALKKLIKTGCSQSEIELVLNNTGERAYKPNEFGNKIIVSRTLSETGSSSFRLKNDKGKIVSSRKDDLENMLAHLQIQVSNPVSILNQDTARTFFQSTDSKKKYTIFVQATQIDEMHELIVEIFNNRRTIDDAIKMRKTDIDTMANEIADLQKKVEKLEKVKRYQNKKDEFEEEYLWAEVHKCRALIQEQEANLQNQTAQVDELQETMNQKSALEQDIREKIEELKKIIEEQKSKEKEYNDLCQKARDKYRNVRRTCASKSHELESVNREFEKKKTDVKVVKEEISRLESLATQNNDKLLEIRRKREELQETLQGLSLTVQEADREKTVLRDTENNTRNRAQRVQNSIQALENEKRTLNHQLSNLQSKKDTLNIYDSYMKQLVEAIDRACDQGKFIQRPKGPLGQYVQVNDEAWGPAVENFLGYGFLKSFLVDNSKDNMTLRKIMNDVCRGRRRPDIHITKFNNKVYDKVRTNEVKYKHYKSVFSTVTISDPDVTNSLIDNKGIETVLLIDDNTKIAQLLENVQTVPKNCSRCLNQFADLYYPAPSYRQYDGLDPRKKHRCQLLQANVENAREAIQQRIQETDREIATHNNEVKELHQELKESHNQMKYWTNLSDAKRKEIADVRRKISSLEEENESEEYRLPILAEEARSLEADITRIESKLQKLNDETEEMKAEAESAKREYEQLQRPLNNGDDSDISRQLDAKKDLLKETLAEKKSISNRLSESAQRISFIENKIKSCQEEEEQKRLAAERVCAERETRRLEDILKDLKEVKKYIDSAQSLMGGVTYDEMCLTLQQQKLKHRKIEKGLMKLADLYNEYAQLTKSRKKMFSRQVEVKSADVKIQFQSVLNVRNYKGKLSIDHDNREIKIMVSPTDGGSKAAVDTTSLSGGERSYSAVAFIMALWKAIDLPFYSMDEFDVFMDKVNRTYIIELLKVTTKDKPKCQFLFLTPQDTSNVEPSEDVSIFRMNDPERTGKN